jgi:nickel transport protein
MPEKRWLGSTCRPVPWVRVILLLLLALAIAAPPALAHRLLVFAYSEGNTIHTESTLIPNTPVRQGQVQVLAAPSGKVLLTGTTNDQGKFSFAIPPEAAAQQMDLKVAVEAAMGHRGEWLLKADSYLAGVRPATAAPPATAPAPAAAPTPGPPGTKSVTVDRQALDEALNKALERQLAPIQGKLAELTAPRTSLRDIIGGIGYVLGLFGLWAYLQSTRKKTP